MPYDKATIQFLEDLRRSELVDEQRLDQALKKLEPHDDAEVGILARLTATLVEMHLLTQWQIEKLLQRKFRGFILDEFVITELLERNSEFARYKAFDRIRQREVLIRVPPMKKWRSAAAPYEVEQPG